MGDMFRSEKMVLAQLFVQPEAAYFAVSELGESGVVQFRDLNENVNAFQRRFVNEVRRCDEMERKLRYVEAEVKKDNVVIPDVRELPRAPNPREIIDFEAHLEKTEGDIKELTESAINLKSTYLELVEFKHVLVKTQVFFKEQEETGDVQRSLLGDEAATGRGSLGFVTGVLKREKIAGFERMLWRICRGNIFFRQIEIDELLEDPVTGHPISKTVFIAFFQGEELKSRISKVCAGYHASLHACPDTPKGREELLKGVNTRLADLSLVLNQTEDHRLKVLVNVAKELQNWSVMVSKMKAIYHTLNYFNVDVTKKCLIGECWVPTNDVSVVQKALAEGSNVTGSSIPSFLNVLETNEVPPTYNRTNKFTRGFQNLIDSYGVASYREVNPSLYTIITFPFLFAVMFGDVGHAIIMTLFGLVLVLKEKQIGTMRNLGEIGRIFFSGRYIILLMGFFSIYTGIVYNDIFSKSLNIFGTRWTVHSNISELVSNDQFDLNPRGDYSGTPYFIGVDPVWQVAKNKIIFLNSFKMKLSIVFGVAHMIFGVCVSVINFVHFKRFSSIFLEFIPQVTFLILLFLWLVVMMFIKWIQYSADVGLDPKFGTSCAPNVLIYFINMMLFKATEPSIDKHVCEAYMFEGQDTLQKILVFGALICIPVLLLGKPLYVKFTRKPKVVTRRSTRGNVALEEEQIPESLKHSNAAHNEEEEEPMSEIFIHQAIHTIEYILSTISHTASYLRLWALSLAHAQLSEVLWTMIFNMGLKNKSFVGVATTFIFFSLWAFFTIGILVLMEGLSAFLHTLRLHWVEFMSKFYEGLGYLFQPFSFKAILDEENARDE